MNYTTLVAAKTTAGSLANWVNRSDLPATEILAETEAWLYQRLRVREMVTDAAFTFADATSSTALPAALLDPIKFQPYEWGEPLPFIHEEAFRPGRDSAGALFEGTPGQWTIIGTTAHVDVLCDGAFAGRLMYYAQPTALGSGNLTNFLTTRYPKLLRRACMAQAYEHMKDTQRAIEYAQYAELDIAEAMRTNDMARRGQYVPA